MTIRTQAALLAAIPSTTGYNRGPQNMGPVKDTLLQDMVDTIFSGPLAPKAPVRFASAAALPAYTYAAGVITANANGAAAAVDGITPVAGDRMCLRNGAAGLDNGIYVYTSIGAAGAPFILTRAADLPVGANAAGIFFSVEEGTTLGDKMLLCTTDNPTDIVGTDALAFSTTTLLGLSASTPGAVAAAAVVGTEALAAHGDHVHAHGLLANGGAEYHDSDQLENLSAVTGADVSTALDQLQAEDWARGVMPPARACTTAALPAYTIVAGVMTEDVAAAGFPAIDGAAVVGLDELFIHTSGAAPADNGWWQLTDLGGALTQFTAIRPPGFEVGDPVSGVRGRVLDGTYWGGREVVVLETTGVVDTDSVTPMDAHSLAADGRALFHDTDQVEDISLWNQGDLSTALELIRARVATRVLSLAGLQTSDGASLVVALYDIDMTAGAVLIAGIPAWFTALNDVVLIGAGSGAIPCFNLAGGAATVADASNDIELALVCLNLAGVPTLYGVTGAQAGTGTAVAPTHTEIHDALVAAAVATLDTTAGVIVGRILYARDGAGNVVATHRGVGTYADLAFERAAGNLEA